MDLYQEILLEHSKRPHHAGLRESFNAQVHYINPTCGDEVTLRIQLCGEGRSAIFGVRPRAQPPDRAADGRAVG